ncbi:hypothetical protein Gotri_011296 [Gossypium trilobum]|uniref:Uncharacterized protein n=1 Tax=Gossypium trilobum TaxID=34281 RepID=A0A7J9ETA1_9ROSI|nr:hypothetical protein [Gossypium trilobum]
MKRCVSDQKVAIFFPHLVAMLCKSAEMRKEKMDVPPSLKRKEKMTTRKIGESSEVKIDGMIQWMQEVSLVLHVFAQQKMRVPSYLPSMFGSTQSHHEGEEQESQEEENDEPGEEGDEEKDFGEDD